LKQSLHKQLQRSFLRAVENFSKSSMETKITLIKLSRINLIPARLDAILSRIDCLSERTPQMTHAATILHYHNDVILLMLSTKECNFSQTQ
jgi:hypothetical protein